MNGLRLRLSRNSPRKLLAGIEKASFCYEESPRPGRGLGLASKGSGECWARLTRLRQLVSLRH